MTPSTGTWLISTISKRLERIAEGKEPMAEDRALTLLSILKDVAGDIPSLSNLPQHVKEWLEAAINARLDAIAEKKDGVAGRSVMADKVQEIAPEHVHVGDDEFGTLSVDKGASALEMVMALIEKLKEEQELGEDDGTDGEN